MEKGYGSRREAVSSDKNLPAVWETNAVIALFCSDIHLSLHPPIARSAEPDWLETQAGYLDQLCALWHKLQHPVVVIAGDIFDRWNPTPEVINLALKHLPNCIAIPGQHDLPSHRLADMSKSAFGTLIEAEKIDYPTPGFGWPIDNLRIWGFPWSTPVTPLPPQSDRGMVLEIAVVHKYVWTNKTGYPGAPEEGKVDGRVAQTKFEESINGYDIAVCGDNHIPFQLGTKNGFEFNQYAAVYNCGAFIARHSNERKHRPSVGLLHQNGAIERHYLDISQDKWLDDNKIPKGKNADLEAFVGELLGLADSGIDFQEVVKRAVNKKSVPAAVRECVLKVMEEAGE